MRDSYSAVRYALRPASLLLALLLGVAGLAFIASPQAVADIDPDPGTPATVAADALPTVQINGVVWSQTVVGNIVYAAGKFTSARPAGSPAGTNEVTRNNLLAYNIETGALVTSFAPNLNAQALTVTPSPDGSRIYVGGSFTQVNGVVRSRIAALNPTTGALINGFAPAAQTTVR